VADPVVHDLGEWLRIRQQETARAGEVVDPRAPTPTVLIATVDHTRETRAYSLRYTYSMGARGRAEFDVRDYDSSATAFRPAIDDRVELRHQGATVFRGKILSVADRPLGAPGVGTVTAVTAVDDWAVASQRRVSEYFDPGQALKTVVTTIVTKYLAVYGITVDPTMAAGPTLPALTFDAVTVEEAFNQLVDLTGGWVYRLHPTGKVEWFGQMHRTLSQVWSAENNNIVGPITWTRSRIQHANRVLLRYGTGLVGGGQTFHGDGVKTRFKLTFPVAQVGHLQYIGGPYPPPNGAIELVGLDATTPRPWYLDAATQELVRNVGAAIPGGVAAAPAVGHTIVFYYNIQFPQTATAETPEAATFPIEAILERADIFDPGQAQAVAATQLDKVTATPRTVTIATRLPGSQIVLPGDSIRLDVPARTLPLAVWLVVEAAIAFEADQQPTVTWTLLEGTGGVLLFSWINFWRDVVGAGAGVGIATGSVINPPWSTSQPPPGELAGVAGPAGATDRALARWDGITGKTLRNSIVTLSDAGLMAGAVFPAVAGLKLQDTNASHVLRIDMGSDLTAERVLTLQPGDAHRFLALTATNNSLGGTAYVVGGPDVAVADGGTGLSSYAVGDLLVATGPTTLARLPPGAVNQVLVINAGLIPGWGPAPMPPGYTPGYVPGGTDVAVADGGTGLSSYSIGDLLVATGSQTLARLNVGSANQVLAIVGGLPTWVTGPGGGTGTGIGDVSGPIGSTPDGIAVFADGTGKLLRNTLTRLEPVTGDLLLMRDDGLQGSNLRTNGALYANGAELVNTITLGNQTSSGQLTAEGATARFRYVTSKEGISEYARPWRLGDWVNVPYNAGDFSTAGGGAWTVAAGNYVAYRYSLVGHTVILSFNFQNTTIAGTAGISLQVKLPAYLGVTFTPAAQMANCCIVVPQGVAGLAGYSIVTAGGGLLLIRRPDNAAWPAGAAHMYGEILYETSAAVTLAQKGITAAVKDARADAEAEAGAP
jgi:hypothetical protein